MNTMEVLTLLLVVFAALTYIDNHYNIKSMLLIGLQLFFTLTEAYFFARSQVAKQQFPFCELCIHFLLYRKSIELSI